MSEERDQLMRDLAESLSDDTEAPAVAPPPSLNLGPGVYAPDQVPIEAYVADPCRDASLRSSDVGRILRFTPAHVVAHHPRLSSKPAWAIARATRKMDAGSIVHALVLGHGSRFVVIDPTAYRTKDGNPAKGETAEYKAEVARARASGLIDLKPKVSEIVDRTSARLREQIERDYGLITDANVEQTLVWEERTPHGLVLCRTRPDLLRLFESSAYCLEVKTSGVDLDDDGVQRLLSASHGGYLIQAAWQLRGINACYPHLAGRVTHIHLFGELQYPNLVAPVSASRLALEQADRRCRRAIERFAEWRAEGLLERPSSWEERIGNMAPWLEKAWMTEEEEDLGATPEAFV